MKIVDDFINRIGTDKVMHFLAGALITAQFEVIAADPSRGWLMFVAIAFVAVLAVVKELVFDDVFDFKDVFATLLGACVELWSLIFRMWFFCELPFGGID